MTPRALNLAAFLPLVVTTFAGPLACDNGRAVPAPAPAASAPAPAAREPREAGSEAPPSPLVLAPRDGLRWEQAPGGSPDAAPYIRDALTRAHAEGRALLVYVGAAWCEPCQRFHHAVESGELDTAFPRLSVLAFDADRDREALATAGYASRLIPLFAIPKSDGSASGKQIEGSVKGETAVGEITPRLRALVAAGPGP